MNRSSLSLIVLLATLFFANHQIHAAPATPQKPNIIFILADDLGYGDVSCYGQKHFQTPNIDALAQQGMKFTEAYSGSPICGPSRCSLLTGLDTGHSLVRDNGEIHPPGKITGGQMPLPPGTMTLGRMLQSAGYKTACVGKWGLGGHDSTGIPTRQGFNYFFGALNQLTAHLYYPPYLWQNNVKFPLSGNPPWPGPHEKSQSGKIYSNDVETAHALQFIKRNKNQRFFLYFTPTIPHAGMQVAEDSLAKFMVNGKSKFPEKPYQGNRTYAQCKYPNATYAAMITRLDGYVGKLMATLKAEGLDKNTLVIFSSDNGPSNEGGNNPWFFESMGPFNPKWSPLGGKTSVFEAGDHEPFIAWWPGHIKAGAVNNQVIAFWDMMPTFAQLTGIISPHTDGISVLPTLLGEPGQKQPDYLYWELRGQQAVRKGDWKAIRRHKNGQPTQILLFNLKTDPGEKHNVANSHPEIVAQLKEIMHKARTPSKVKRWNFED